MLTLLPPKWRQLSIQEPASVPWYLLDWRGYIDYRSPNNYIKQNGPCRITDLTWIDTPSRSRVTCHVVLDAPADKLVDASMNKTTRRKRKIKGLNEKTGKQGTKASPKGDLQSFKQFWWTDINNTGATSTDFQRLPRTTYGIESLPSNLQQACREDTRKNDDTGR